MHGPPTTAGVAAALLGLALLAGAAAQSPQPVTHADCPDLPAVHVFTAWPTALENLAFAGGAVYVSDPQTEALARLAADGSAEVVARFADLHGVVADGQGVVHFAARDGSEPEGEWRVWRLGPDGPVPYSGLTRGWNGMAFADAGDLYLSDVFGEGIYRIPADHPARSELWLEVDGANGLAYDPAARILYAAVMTDQRSPILRIPIDDPEAATEIHLTFGAVRIDGSTHPPSDPRLPLAPKILDDLTLGPDGMLYAAAHGAGEVLRVDPATGAACVLAKGLKEPTSVRVASGFPPFDGDLFVTTFGGVFASSQLDREAGQRDLPPPRAVPREPALLRIATGLDVAGATEPEASTPPPVARALPAPALGVLLALAAAALLAGSTGRSRASRRRRRDGG